MKEVAYEVKRVNRVEESTTDCKYKGLINKVMMIGSRLCHKCEYYQGQDYTLKMVKCGGPEITRRGK